MQKTQRAPAAYPTFVAARFSAEQALKLHKLAAKSGTTLSQVLRELVDQAGQVQKRARAAK